MTTASDANFLALSRAFENLLNNADLSQMVLDAAEPQTTTDDLKARAELEYGGIGERSSARSGSTTPHISGSEAI